MEKKIKKLAGYEEPFDIKKLAQSLQWVGCSEEYAFKLAEEMAQKNFKTTDELHQQVLFRLDEEMPVHAIKYNAKRAILEFGPAGFPFEKYVAALLEEQEYVTEVGKTVAGQCAPHEVDVIAVKGNQHYMIECKFHHKFRYASDIKIALYVHARFEDIRKAWEAKKEDSHEFHQGWIVTNTRFTKTAVQYASCAGGFNLVSWDYPKGHSLKNWVDYSLLYPITAIPMLSKNQKIQLIKRGVVVCDDILVKKDIVRGIGLSKVQQEKLFNDVRDLCVT